MELAHLLPHELQRALAEGWPLLVPAGCVEYHGPHLPLGVDTLIVEELVRQVAGRADCVVAPAFAYGPTGYAVTGPDEGTLDVSTERFGRHVKDAVSYTHLRAHETRHDLVCRLLLEKKKKK